MPLIGKLAALIFIVALSICAYVGERLLQPRLQGREPCRRWFALVVGTLAGASVFSCWTGTWGLGAAEPGFRGAAFGLFGGLIWGGFFAFVLSLTMWQAFQPPDSDRKSTFDDLLNADVRAVPSRILRGILSFRPTPGFRNVGVLPWGVFFTVVMLTVFWSWAFCLLTWATEGAPGQAPVMPLNR
jgi:hypothetical protein